MDVTTLKRACGVGLLAATALTNPVAHAANGSVNVDVNLPTVLVMYYFSNVTLNVDEAGLATYLGAGGIACAGDYCDAQPDPGAIDVLSVTATTNVPMPALNDPYGAGPGAVTFVLQDVVGVRALGCTAPYSATYDVGGGDPAVTQVAGLTVANINGVACSMNLLTGDLAFDLDFDAVPAGATSVNAVLDVTITGV